MSGDVWEVGDLPPRYRAQAEAQLKESEDRKAARRAAVILRLAEVDVVEDVPEDRELFAHPFIAEAPTGGTSEVARFVLDGEPMSKARPRFARKGDKTYTFTPEATVKAEEAIAWAFRQAAPHFQPNDVIAYGIVAHFVCATRHRRDIDNMVKLILDGLNKVAWADDNQVAELIARKSVDPEGARTEVIIYEAGDFHTHTYVCPACGGPKSARAVGLCRECYLKTPAHERGNPMTAERVRLRAIEEPCPVCGLLFRPWSRSGRVSRTCSVSCSNRLRARMARQD